ncbi:PP2C family protein-serine/threonine phosphatase [Streptacidiphilus sp. PB12-B1b]|uniref:PP2C family protein-serine/threonine phosphatase n=1 Tax=Streptacidiphilus sp. PB12-B1b TaxID=2705012 RepID=UPI001CDD0731|nr:GAF domain-containing SpoIIE family protein phosphatase [Streptacidiphilus sp. PB12-B1b]
MTAYPDDDEPYELECALQDALDRLTLLSAVSEALASTLEPELGLRRLCRVLVPALADWCAVDLLREDGRLHRMVVEHRDPGAAPRAFEALLPPAAADSPSPLVEALRASGPVRLDGFPGPETAADPLHRFELRAFAVLGARRAVLVPLVARHRVLGVLTLAQLEPDGRDGTDRMPLIEDVAHRVGLALDNDRLHAQIARIAERLQRSLLPDLPQHGLLDIAARYTPARDGAEVGGDWYDAFLLPDDTLTLIIGDVTGHDLKAAVSMSQVRNMLRGIACDRKEPPGKILARLDAANAILYPGQTLTCLYALLDQPDPAGPWHLDYAVAGHLPPLLVTREGGTRFLEQGRSLLLGVRPHRTRPQATELLPPGATVLLYTDGLIERRDEPLDEGMTRLRQRAAALATAPLGTFCDTLMAGPGGNCSDDIALIAVRIPPRPAHRDGAGDPVEQGG